MKQSKLSLLMFLVFVWWLPLATRAATAASVPLLLRDPTISRTQIAFAYGGDIWIVARGGGAAHRLVTGYALDTGPVFSPDGSLVAFSGRYDGNVDVYVVPSTGGEPRRLTYHPDPDYAVGWTPDGTRVLFRSHRKSSNDPNKLFTVPASGGFATELPLDMAETGSYSRDGTHLAYVPHFRFEAFWQGYRGGQTTPVRIANLADSRVETVPRDTSNDHSPMWIGNTVFFLSDRDGPVTLFSYNTRTRRVARELPSRGFDITSASAGDGEIVYAQFDSLHVFDPATHTERQFRPGPRKEHQFLHIVCRTISCMKTAMKLPIAGQLGLAFAVPIVALVLLAGAVSLGFSQLDAARQDMVAKAHLSAIARDITTQSVSSRFANRGSILTGKASYETARMKAIDAARADVAYVAAHAALLPGSAAEIAGLPAQLELININSSTTSSFAKRDHTGAMDYFYHDLKTGRNAPLAAAFEKSKVDQAVLDATIAAITAAAADAETASSAAFAATLSWLNIIMVGITLATITVTVVLTVLLSRRMSKRLGRVARALAQLIGEDFADLHAALARLKQGDLRTSLHATAKPLGDAGFDEIADVARSCDALDAGLVQTGVELSAGLTGLRELIWMMGEDVRLHSDLNPNRRIVFLGKAAIYSAGTTFMSFFARENRYLTLRTRLMIHERKLSKVLTIDGPLTTCVAKVKATLNEIEASIIIQNEGFENLIRGSQVSMEQVLERAPSNWYIESAEAQRLGLIEAVL